MTLAAALTLALASAPSARASEPSVDGSTETAAVALSSPTAAASTAAVVVDRFSGPVEADGTPVGWKPLRFRRIQRHTRYALEGSGEERHLTARSSGSASGLIRTAEALVEEQRLGAPIRVQEYPRLEWRWKVAGSVQGADGRRKDGDDYAARVYVAFAYDPERATLLERARYRTAKVFYGDFPPSAAINYVWDHRLRPGTEFDNAYTDKVKMVVVRSGDAQAGEWILEHRDVLADYRRLFGGEPPELAFIAVMTDTDDTGQAAEAAYDDIVLRREDAPVLPLIGE